MSVELNGIAHIQLTVRDAKACLPFWESLCNFLDMKTLIKGNNMIYCIGSRTGILVRTAAEEDKPDELAFNQWRAGLHHFCLRARSKEDVDAVHKFATTELNAKIVHPPQSDGFAPGYYSVLFEDPEGIRVEVNHVPGRGHFGKEGRLGNEGTGPATNITEDGLND
jgi:catechol 2,3-dioxygenase-like lactoylglutathione lyase family enzyme